MQAELLLVIIQKLSRNEVKHRKVEPNVKKDDFASDAE
jgi:hypothetical protein